MENNIFIVAIKKDDKYYYIGKTSTPQEKNIPTNSDLTYQYHNSTIRNVFKEGGEIVNLKESDRNKWYDDKLNEVTLKHSDNNLLLNSVWMKEGKRGYWEGKKRDPYTLKRLSESKYKKVIQYDKDGNFIKQWNSLKEIATKLIGDYKVVNGSAESKIYHLLSKKKPKYIRTRLFKNNYWFKEHELIEYFGIIPKKINIKNILDNEEKIRHIIRKENYKKSKKTKLYTVIQYDNYGNVINNFKNVFHAGYVLKKSPETISRISRSDIKSTLNLKYGPKKSYPINERYNYPDYKITPTPRIYKNNKKRYKTRTRSTIEVIKNNQSLGVFDDINLVVKEIKINANKIYRYMRLNKPTKEGYLFINRGKKQIKLDSLKNTLLNFKQTL